MVQAAPGSLGVNFMSPHGFNNEANIPCSTSTPSLSTLSISAARISFKSMSATLDDEPIGVADSGVLHTPSFVGHSVLDASD